MITVNIAARHYNASWLAQLRGRIASSNRSPEEAVRGVLAKTLGRRIATVAEVKALERTQYERSPMSVEYCQCSVCGAVAAPNTWCEDDTCDVCARATACSCAEVCDG